MARSPWTRREFVGTSAAVLSVAVPLRHARGATLITSLRTGASARSRAERFALPADPEHIRALAMRAIDAAKSAGATYAEVRLTRIVDESLQRALGSDSEEYAIGVRALFEHAWGFAASPYWDLDEAAQLAKDAVAQAKINSRVNTRIDAQPVDLGHYPAAVGSWRTPVRIDPFQISIEEKTDFVHSVLGLVPPAFRGFGVSGDIQLSFDRQERTVATTEGAYFTQTLYSATSLFAVKVMNKETSGGVGARGLGRAALGWEQLLDAKLREQIPKLVDDAIASALIPIKPVEVGRYDVVCDAGTLSGFVDGTFGRATELDRVLGYEANAGGVSYLGPDPFAHLGTPIGSSLLNVRGDRSMAAGLATVQWDDEGVVPETFALVQDGMLVDFSTVREHANWLGKWYTSRHQPIRSHGCASAASAMDTVQSCTPNLTLMPGTGNGGFNELVASTKRGIAVTGGFPLMDFQSRSGMCVGEFREIIDGKIGARLGGAGMLFDSLGLWKNLVALGGAASQECFSGGETKGQPTQSFARSIAAVPGVFKGMAVVDQGKHVI